MNKINGRLLSGVLLNDTLKGRKLNGEQSDPFQIRKLTG